jgi:hypothetical protein
MRPDLREEGLIDRETDSSGFHERSTALHVAQSHAHPRQPTPATCSAWTAAPAVTRSWAAHRAARKVYCLKFAGENFSEVRVATTALLERGFAVCVILGTRRTKEGGI